MLGLMKKYACSKYRLCIYTYSRSAHKLTCEEIRFISYFGASLHANEPPKQADTKFRCAFQMK